MSEGCPPPSGNRTVSCSMTSNTDSLCDGAEPFFDLLGGGGGWEILQLTTFVWSSRSRGSPEQRCQHCWPKQEVGDRMYVDMQGDPLGLTLKFPWGRGGWVKLFCDMTMASLGDKAELMQPLCGEFHLSTTLENNNERCQNSTGPSGRWQRLDWKICPITVTVY
jgi:hypothetical protein